MPRRFLCIVAGWPCIIAPMAAQSGYEIEVYGSPTVPVHSLLLELHTNYIFDGQQLSTTAGRGPVVDDRLIAIPARAQNSDSACTATTRPAFRVASAGTANPAHPAAAATATSCSVEVGDHTTHETFEAATGLRRWIEVGAYVFASKQGDAGAQWAGQSFRAKVELPESWHPAVGVALSTEVEHELAPNAAGTWTLEVRPVVDKTWGRWSASVNPTISRILSGVGAPGAQFSPSARLQFDVSRRISGGVEYYGAFGELGAFAPPSQRLQQFFGTTDIRPSTGWEIEAGLGLGTTTATDRLTAKLILEHTLSWGRP